MGSWRERRLRTDLTAVDKLHISAICINILRVSKTVSKAGAAVSQTGLTTMNWIDPYGTMRSMKDDAAERTRDVQPAVAREIPCVFWFKEH